MAPLLGLGIGFLTDLVGKYGEDLVVAGVEKVTGVDLKKDELTSEDKKAIMAGELALKELDFKKLELELESIKEANRHQESAVTAELGDKQNAIGAAHLSEAQTSIANKIYAQSMWMIPGLLIMNAGLIVYADKLNMDTTAVVAVGNLIGMALNSAYRERQSILEFLFGSSVNGKNNK